MLETLKEERVAGVPVPLKFTHAFAVVRQFVIGLPWALIVPLSLMTSRAVSVASDTAFLV